MELIDLVNSVIIFLSQMTLFRWLTFLPGSQTVILIVLLFWIYFFLLMLFVLLCGFPSIWKFCSHWFSIKYTTGFPVSLHSLWLFSCWLGQSLCDHLRDVPWKDIFKLSAYAYIPFGKYQVKRHWEKSFLLFVRQNKSSKSKRKLRQASNCCIRVL